MKRKRYLPFGYRIQDGTLTTEPQEAALVVRIFENYLEGASLQKLTELAQASGIQYRENAEKWNKAMIARILDCTWYAGRTDVPAVISVELSRRAAVMRQKKAQIHGGALNTEMRMVRGFLCCGRCGHTLERVNHKNADYIRWRCSVCCTETDYIPDQQLLDAVRQLLNDLAKHPEKVQPKQSDNRISMQAVRLENEIRREMKNPKTNEEVLLNMICACAQEKYKVCSAGQEDVCTHRIQEVLQGTKADGQPDAHSFQQILKKILITPQGGISIQLRNGVIV